MMTEELTLPAIASGMVVATWILGKAIRSIPSLYEDSKTKKGTEMYGDLSMLLGFRVIKILLILGGMIWGEHQLGYSSQWLKNVTYAIFIALFAAGFLFFLVLTGTLLLAKITKIQAPNNGVDILDHDDRMT